MDTLLLTTLPTFVVLVFLLAPLGCFLMWQRMAFLGDTLSHSAILGVALGICLHIPLSLANFIYLGLFVLLLKWLLTKQYLPKDSVLSLLSYGGMALGLILLHFKESSDNFEKVLLGNILTVSFEELIILIILTSTVLTFLYKNQKKMIIYILDKDLAKTSGIKTESLENTFLILTAFSIAFAMQCVGALIVPALLIIPSCAVRSFSFSYQSMIKNVVLFAGIMLPIGIYSVKMYDLPFGPSIIITYIVGFIIVQSIYKTYKIINLKKTSIP